MSLRPIGDNFTFELPNAPSTAPGVRRNSTSTVAKVKFAKRVRDFVVRHNLDGVDLDWEYFRDVDKDATKLDSLVSVTRALKNAFIHPASIPGDSVESETYNRENLIITVTSARFPRELTENYDFNILQK